MKNKFSLMIIAILIISLSLTAQEKGTFTDIRDGKIYKTVKIGNQTWMAENLNYETPTGSWCCVDSNINCDKNGRLYNWKTAKKTCPESWHLPEEKEWQILFNNVGGIEIAGTKLRNKEGWSMKSENSIEGTDDFGFNALPNCNRTNQGEFLSISSIGFWWGATSISLSKAFVWYTTSIDYSLFKSKSNKEWGIAVRCVKD